MKFALLSAGLGIALMSLASCSSQNQDTNSMTNNFKYIDRANMDTTVSPGDNFFEYANGAWLKSAKIPADKSRYGSFDQLIDRTDSSVYQLLKTSKPESGNVIETNVANFYASGMDTSKINAVGIKAIQPELDAINAISNKDQLLSVVSDNMKKGLSSIIGMYIAPDDKDVTKIAVQFTQTGLGLPNKDYYTDKDAHSESIRSAYKEYISKILQLSGQDENAAKSNASKIFSIEDKLASASLRPQEMRDPQRMYNKFSVADLSKKTANIKWGNLLSTLGVKGIDSVLVGTPSYYMTLSGMLTSVPVSDWKQYLTFHTISDMSAYIGSDFEKASFAFYGQKLSGQKEMKPRWRRVSSVINRKIGDQLGQLYVDKYFKPEAKKKMLELVGNLQEAFKERINALTWMSDATKQKALIKLAGFVKKIGYPDKWKDYTGLKITPDNYAQNVLNANVFEYNYELAKIGKPVDRQEWFMTPNTVNAYYNPSFNEIVFPAAILQFPFFDFGADDAVNYGGIGAVIGHEMTHGFDDQGAQYAADGNLKNWWTPEDEKKFKEKTHILVDQYNNFKILDSLHVNGELTLGENIADLGGVTIAYQAFKKTKEGQSNEKIDGFTPDQRFFLSWAQVWRGKATNEALQQQIKSDPHSPTEARANVPLSNFTPFYKAFGIKEGDKMWRAENERAIIW